jgi:4-aminobutyrate aminotransferase-like enzyme
MGNDLAGLATTVALSAFLHDRHRRVIPDRVGLYYDVPLEIVSGKGSRVTDASGRRYLDFFCGILTDMLE